MDYSARIQTLHAETNPMFHALLSPFRPLIGCPVLLNTSFNVRGEPIVCIPCDAHLWLTRTEMDCLVLGSYLRDQTRQPPLRDDVDWRRQYQLA